MTKNKVFLKLAASGLTLLLGASLIGGVAYQQVSSAVANAEETESSSAVKKFYTAYDTFQQEQDEASELNEEIAGESFVLMKNRGGALPLSKSETRVTAFGFGSYYTSYGAQGSGTQSVSPFQTLVTLEDGLANSGIKMNPGVLSLYKQAGSAYTASAETSWGFQSYDLAPEDLSTQESSYALYNDAALLVLTREGGEGEGFEFSRTEYYDGTSKDDEDEYAHGLMLTPNEREILAYAEENFDKVIVLINSTNPMEIGELEDDDDVDAVVWVGGPGVSGFNALGKVLTGEINPSGRTVDMYPANMTQDPTWFNYGDQSGALSTDSSLSGDAGEVSKAYDSDGNALSMGTTNIQTVSYLEGIYTGYRWYETQAELGNYYTDENMPNNSDAVYDTEDEYYNRDNGVVYPFGYGMSYTEFEWTDYSVTVNDDRTVTVGITVTNTGDVAGKDVVEIYYTDPYTAGGIEKASANLVEFAKTDELDPGESEKLTVEFELRDMASFDYSDANGNGYSCYELEAGDYVISARSDSHTVKASATVTLSEYIYDGSDDDHNYNDGYGENSEAIFSSDTDEVGDVENRDSDWLYNTSGQSDIQTYVSRADGELSQPTAVISAQYNDDWTARLTTYQDYTAADSKEYNETYGTTYVDDDGIPSSWTQATDTSEDTEIQLYDMAGVGYPSYEYDEDTNSIVEGTDEATKAWDEFLNQLSLDELITISGSDHGSSSAADRYGLPQSYCNDGPSKFQDKDSSQTDLDGNAYDGTWWATEVNLASTFNTDLAYREGLMIGNESLYMGVTGMWGFGLNLHRGAWGAREFEYYSEDGVLSGRIAAATTKGCVELGVVVYNKHFALNDQDEYRNTADGAAVFVNEQALRQLYLKPYEIAVKDGGMNGAMMSFMRVGAVSADNNYNLITKTLRGEWGFQGDICTDAGGGYCGDACILAGCDWPLMSFSITIAGSWSEDDNNVVVDGEVCSTQYYAIRNTAMHFLYGIANSNAMKNGVDTSVFEGTTLEASNGRSTSLSVAVSLDDLNAASAIYELKSGSLPDGLTLDEDGTISGTPTEAGTFTFTVRLTADKVVIAEEEFTLVVNKLFSATNLTGTVGDEDFECVIYSDSVVADGVNYDSVIYSATGLPDGLTMAEDGTIYGTPTTAGSYDVTVTVVATEPTTTYEVTGYESASGGSTSTYTETFTIVITDDGESEETTITVEDLQETIESLESTVESLESQIADLESEVAELSAAADTSSDESTSDEGSSGCGSVVTATGAVVVIGTVLATAVILLRRKKEDR